jgi:Bacterial Ig domain
MPTTRTISSPGWRKIKIYNFSMYIEVVKATEIGYNRSVFWAAHCRLLVKKVSPDMICKLRFCFLTLMVLLAFQACNTRKNDLRPAITRVLQANNDNYRVAANATTFINPLLNDSISEGDFTVGYEDAKNGTLVTTPGKAGFTYTPKHNFTGIELINYIIVQGGQPSSAKIYITVYDAGDTCSWKLKPDTGTTNQNTPITLDVFRNDVVCGISQFYWFQAPLFGTVTMDTLSGACTYIPNLNFIGTEKFSYGFCRNQKCSTATVTISVGNNCNAHFKANQITWPINLVNGGFTFTDSMVASNASFCPGDIDSSVVKAMPFNTLNKPVTKGGFYSSGQHSYVYTPIKTGNDTLIYYLKSKSAPMKKTEAYLIFKVL